MNKFLKSALSIIAIIGINGKGVPTPEAAAIAADVAKRDSYNSKTVEQMRKEISEENNRALQNRSNGLRRNYQPGVSRN